MEPLEHQCVICLGDSSTSILLNMNSYFECQCHEVPFHDSCWNQFNQGDGHSDISRRCPYCRKVRPQSLSSIVIESPVEEGINSREVPQPPSQPQPFHHALIFKSRFIMEYPCWNLLFSLAIIGYSGLFAGLFMVGLLYHYDQMTNLTLVYSFFFILVGLFDVLSTLVDQWFQVWYFIIHAIGILDFPLCGVCHCNWILYGLFSVLVATRILLGLSCVILITFLKSNNFTDSGVVLVILQSLLIFTACCVTLCCQPRN
jgi:hypothetical protein